MRFVHKGVSIQEALWKAEATGCEREWHKFLQGLQDHTIAIAHALPTDAFGIAVDASLEGWGAVLLQRGGVICCASGIWKSEMKHQISNHLEIEAVLKALRKFLPWVFGSRVTVFSDNSSVASFANPENQSAFVRRRLDQLQEFCPQLVFLPGHSNVLPDLLSRRQGIFKEAAAGIHLTSTRDDVADNLRRAHSGHFGPRKTYLIAKELGLEVSMKDVEQYCKQCRICQQFRVLVPSVPLGNLPDPQHVGELISIDYVGPLSPARSGVKYIFTCIDHLSRWGMGFACVRSTTASAKKSLLKWISLRGSPRRVLSDRASYFISSSFRGWLEDLGGELILTPPYSHHSNGLVERYNKAVVGRLRRLCREYPSRTWSGVLPMAVDFINEAPHSVTGFSPNYLVTGCRAGVSVADDQQLQRDRALAVLRTNENRDRLQHVHARGTPFMPEVGALVWVYDAARSERLDQKLHPYWLGPFRVLEVMSPHVYKLVHQDTKKCVVCHVDHLQPYL